MRRLFLLPILCWCLALAIPVSHAQDKSRDDVTEKEYQRFFEERLKMNFRNTMLEALELSKQEIIDLEPLLDEYMDKRVDLAEEKLQLAEEYTAALEKADTDSERNDEKADFVEDFWEYEIEEMELKKRYFDRFEDQISYRKAMQFFLLEDEIQYRITRPYLIKLAPVIIQFKEIGMTPTGKNKAWDSQKKGDWKTKKKDLSEAKEMSTAKQKAHKKEAMSSANTIKNRRDTKTKYGNEAKTSSSPNEMNIAEVEEFYRWVQKPKTEVAADHQYTHDGLTKLAAALHALDGEKLIDFDGIEKSRKDIEKIADKLQKNPKSTKHADWTRTAFYMISEILESGHSYERFTETKEEVAQVASAALMLDPDRLMTEQASTIYLFFENAKNAVEKLMADKMEESEDMKG